mmetsp:Transcript_11703/g.18579  ORF Transcript_11703/g.18579 Transcript_11703/m.18579 type:complete len:85 (-) Transcript_11703:1354-1608(-)
MQTIFSSKIIKRVNRKLARGFSFSVANLDTLPKTTLSTLGNGLRVASEPCAGDSVTVGVWVDTGSRYETEENNGVAHFLEHLFF